MRRFAVLFGSIVVLSAVNGSLASASEVITKFKTKNLGGEIYRENQSPEVVVADKESLCSFELRNLPEHMAGENKGAWGFTFKLKDDQIEDVDITSAFFWNSENGNTPISHSYSEYRSYHDIFSGRDISHEISFNATSGILEIQVNELGGFINDIIALKLSDDRKNLEGILYINRALGELNNKIACKPKAPVPFNL